MITTNNNNNNNNNNDNNNNNNNNNTDAVVRALPRFVVFRCLKDAAASPMLPVTFSNVMGHRDFTYYFCVCFFESTL